MKYYILWIQFLQVLLNLSGNEGGGERVKERYELQDTSEITEKTIQHDVSLEKRRPSQDFKDDKYMQHKEVDKKTAEQDKERESTIIIPQVVGKDGINTKPAIVESRYPIWRGYLRDYMEPIIYDANNQDGDLNVITLPSIPNAKNDNVGYEGRILYDAENQISVENGIFLPYLERKKDKNTADRRYNLYDGEYQVIESQDTKTPKKMKKTQTLVEKNIDLYNDEYVGTPETMPPSAMLKGFSLDEKTLNMKGGKHFDLKNMLQKEYSIVPATGLKMGEKQDEKDINTLNDIKKKPCDAEVKVIPTADQKGLPQEIEAEELELKLHDPIRTSMRVSRVFSNRRRRKKY